MQKSGAGTEGSSCTLVLWWFRWLLLGERREDAGETLGEHRFA